VMTQQQKPVMTTRVLAKPREDAAEDHQVCGGGGPPDDGPGGNPNDGRWSSRRPRPSESENDSAIEVIDRTRSKGELPLNLPPLPKLAGEFEGYRFAVINYIALASGRHRRRIPRVEDTTKARRPDKLEHVPRKNRSLD
jgi:hypothetical protein